MSPNRVIHYYWGANCAPCQSFGPKVEDACRELGIKLMYFQVEKAMDLVRSEGIRSTPTLIGYVDGCEVGRLIGITTRRDLENMLREWGLAR